jgi:uncharacterized protein YndB with AHSA1/START domain
MHGNWKAVIDHGIESTRGGKPPQGPLLYSTAFVELHDKPELLVRTEMATPTTVEKIGMYSSQSVEKHTAKNWDEWIAVLEKAGARNLEHREIAALLKKKYKLTEWWQHAVAWGFEVHIGRKVEGRNAKGRWSLTATKSLPVGAKKVWAYMVSGEGQARWLRPLDAISIALKETFETEDGFFGEIRTMRKGERVRFSWNDVEWDRHSYVQMFIVKRPGEKCLLAFMHTELPDSRSRDQLRARWKASLDAVATELKGKASSKTRPRSR